MARKPPCWSLSTKRVKLTVAYDGTDFCGWAAQTGRRTVQGTLKDAVRQISGEDCEIVGASRTDSGAHAWGQVCHLDLAASIPAERLPNVMNRALPPDVRVQAAQQVPTGFHSRFCAKNRWYRYRITEHDRDPFVMRMAYGQRYRLDLELMREAARELVGKHDFRAFTEELDPRIENTMRELFSIELTSVGGEVRIDIVGTAFLRGMMRRISGYLYEVGVHRRPLAHGVLLLGTERNSLDWPVVLPARGLTLMAVRYGRHPKDIRLRNNESSAKADYEHEQNDDS